MAGSEIKEESNQTPVDDAQLNSSDANAANSNSTETITIKYKATKEAVKKIVDKLKENHEKQNPIVLVGEAGVGKTWIAKNVCESAVERGNCYGTIWISLDQKHDQESLYADIARQFSLLTNADEWDDEEDTDDEKKKSEVETTDEEKLMTPMQRALQKMKGRHEAKTKEEREKRVNRKQDGKAKEYKYLLWVLDEGYNMRDSDIELNLSWNSDSNESVNTADQESSESVESDDAKGAESSEVQQDANGSGSSEVQKDAKGSESSEVQKDAKGSESSEVQQDAKGSGGKSESRETGLSLLADVLAWEDSKLLITTGRKSGHEVMEKIVKAKKNLTVQTPGDDKPFVYSPYEPKHEVQIEPFNCVEASEMIQDCVKNYKRVPKSIADCLSEAVAHQEVGSFSPANVIMILGALNCILEQHTKPEAGSKIDAAVQVQATDPEVAKPKVQIPSADPKVSKPKGEPTAETAAEVPAADPEADSRAATAIAPPVSSLEGNLRTLITKGLADVDNLAKELLLCALEALQANQGMFDHKARAESVEDCFWHRWDIFRARGKEENKYIKSIKLDEIRANQGKIDNKITAGSVLDCFWHSRDFFKARRGGVHYNELVTYWVLEGCFDPVDDLKKAYQEGHDVLMKLVDYGMIRLQEDNAIYMEGLHLDIEDGRFLGVSATANFRMAKMLEETNLWRGFGRIAPADGMIKTLRVGNKKEEDLVSTMLVDGSCIHRETPEQLFLHTQKLHALGMFDAMLSDPTYSIKAKTHFPPVEKPKTTDSTSNSSEPSKTPDSTSDPSKAVAPEKSVTDGSTPVNQSEAAVSVSSNPSKATESTTSNQPKAEETALSDPSQAADTTSSQVKEDTRALIASTKNLQVLVFRHCYLLKELDFIKHLEALTALEVSGAILLKKIPDELFEKTIQLRSLNLSDLGVESLPSTLSNLTQLQRLILKRCSRLRTLPAIRNLKRIEVVDLGGCCSLEKMADMCLQSLENLEILDLSYTRLQRMPIVNSMKCLSQVLLKGCDNIGAMRKLAGLTALTHLNISGVNKVREIHEDFLKGTENIEVVDLSGTGIEELPPFVNPRVLNLKGCSKLTKIPDLPDIRGCSGEAKNLSDIKGSLEFLDLSDASFLDTIDNDSFEHLENLQYLNFSNTKVQKLPSLNGLTRLQHLLLEGLSLEKLPEMGGLSGLKEFKLSGCKNLISLPSLADCVKLEDLDLSGCEALSEVPDNSFQHLKLLQRLNLSETKIKSLPPLSECGNLKSLVLKNCKNLEIFPRLESLSKLEELDLMGANKLVDVQAEYFKDLTALQVMKLPKIKAEELSKISILRKVKKLSLDSWSGDASATWPTLEGLEVLEISDDAAESLKSLDSFSGLHKLSLRGSKWTTLPSLKSLVHLETLDLSGTGIEEFTEITQELSELPQFKCLRVPQLKLILKNGCWEKLTRRSIYIDCEDWEGSLPDGKKPYVMVQSTQFFRRWEASQLTEALDRINFSIHSSKMQARKGISHPDTWYSIHSKIRDFPPQQEGRCLEIQGFDVYPADVTDALKEAEHVSLVDNKFLSCISDLYLEMRNSIMKDKSIESGEPIPEANKSNLHLEIQEKMTSCWLERCTEVTRIYKEPYTVLKVEKELRFAVNLQILRISSLLKLKSFYEGGKRQCFENLKELYIDSCPMLETVFSSEQTVGSLHTLEIKFCGSLETVFAYKEIEKPHDENTEEAEAVLEEQFASASNLQNLYISHCPMLKTVYPSPELPTELQSLEIKYCDNLDIVFGKKESPPSKSSKESAPGESDPSEESDQPEGSNQLQVTAPQAPNEAETEPIINSTKLKVLRLCHCPKLETVYYPPQLPEEIGTLEIVSCDELKPKVTEWEKRLKHQSEPEITQADDH